MALSFLDFIKLGSEQWRIQRNPWVALFMWVIGPIGVHSRIRNGRVLNAFLSNSLLSGRVLDIGSGWGYSLFWLARHFPDGNFVGIETDQELVKGCQEITKRKDLKNLSFYQGGLGDVELSGNFNSVICVDVLEHIRDDQAVLEKIADLLDRDTGRILIHVPLRHQLQKRIFPIFKSHEIEDHVRDEYLPDEIAAKMKKAGFDVMKMEYGFGFWGELSFELNYLFWERRWLRNFIALMTLPITLVLGFIDTRIHINFGNSLLLLGKRHIEP